MFLICDRLYSLSQTSVLDLVLKCVDRNLAFVPYVARTEIHILTRTNLFFEMRLLKLRNSQMLGQSISQNGYWSSLFAVLEIPVQTSNHSLFSIHLRYFFMQSLYQSSPSFFARLPSFYTFPTYLLLSILSLRHLN